MELVQLLISGISQGCVYGLIALGFVLIYKATEMVNFAQGDLMMLGAFIAFGFINVLGWPFLWGFLATLAVMGVVGVTLERLLLRPMIGEPPFAVLMLTIGLGFILRAVAGAIWGYEDKTLSTPYGGGVARWGEISVGYENIAVVLGTLVLCVLVFVFFRKTRVGIAMQAASQNQLAAYYVGIPVKWIFALVWAMSAMISATAGILVAPLSLINPIMGFVGIKAFAAAIVGGFGSLPGAFLAGLMIGIVEQFAKHGLPSGLEGFSETTAYVILLIMLFIRPEGIFATMQRKKV
ncbi:MAG: branched-chain amino acid ABC transporter permease [Pseudomonadota bacterium]|uniref:Branched-chain amino acid ABC transporter permease n=1 Tax=marine metagenome TaxID=408172 RepID=A0A381QU41_9ZZZZ|nr:branched-chain amino acid ABC transporter permease [Pseudomonadota bacterium]